MAGDKSLTKKVLRFHEILTPQFATVFRGALDHVGDLRFPLIVKPPQEDASLGITSKSVVRDVKELLGTMDSLQREFQSPVLVEEFVDGREFYVGVLGNESPVALPVIELDFSAFPSDRPKVASWEAKWGEGGTGGEDGDRRRIRRTKSIFPTRSRAGADRAHAGGRGGSVQRAPPPGLWTGRSAGDAVRGDLRDRGESQLLSGAQWGVRARGREARDRPGRSGRPDRGVGAGAIRALSAIGEGGTKEAGAICAGFSVMRRRTDYFLRAAFFAPFFAAFLRAPPFLAPPSSLFALLRGLFSSSHGNLQ